jgi:hypothetical protein
MLNVTQVFGIWLNFYYHFRSWRIWIILQQFLPIVWMQSVTIWKMYLELWMLTKILWKCKFVKPNRHPWSNELAFMAPQLYTLKHYNLYKRNSFICKSFINPVTKGTSVSKVCLEFYLVFYCKRNQLLISLSSIDFFFIMEENIEIFAFFI